MAAGLLVMSPLLLAELDHVGTRDLGRDGALSAVDDIRRWMGRGRVVVPEIGEDRLGAAQSFRRRYGPPGLDLADAVNVVPVADYGTDGILTLDRRDSRTPARPSRGVPGAARRAPAPNRRAPGDVQAPGVRGDVEERRCASASERGTAAAAPRSGRCPPRR